MLDSRTLTLAADALDARSAALRGIGSTFSEVQPLAIAAEDCRREVEAASGFANPATLALRIVVDNDRTMYDALTERARTIRDRSAELREALIDADDMANPDMTADEARRKLTVSYLADDLRDFLRFELRERVETAGIYHASKQIPGMGEPARKRAQPLNVAAVEMVSAMAAHALDAVDWLDLASDCHDRANQLGEYAPSEVSR